MVRHTIRFVTTSRYRPLTGRALNRATLARQLLLERAPLDVEAGVRRIVAIQAQESASPYIALWARLAAFDAADLDHALARGSIVKASLMRITLHAVAATDYHEFHRAMQSTLRGSRLYDPRFTVTDMPSDEVDALVPQLLVFAAEPRTNAEVEAWLDERLGPGRGRQVWWAVRTFAPFRHAVTTGPWSFGPRPAYVATPPPHERDDPATSLPALIRRYLAGLGPATVADIAQFTLIQRSRVRAALDALGGDLLYRDRSDGAQLVDMPGAALPDEDVPAPPRLLPMWDSILFAYADRSRIIPPAFRSHVIRRNGDTLPTLLVDGHVAGVWRPTPDGIEATAFEPLSDETWAGLEAEARSLLALLANRDPGTYRRYGRWWAELPGAQVRTLGSDRQPG